VRHEGASRIPVGACRRRQVNIPKPSQISSDFIFGNAPNDDAYRQVVDVDHEVVIRIELILFVGFLLAVIAVTVTVIVLAIRRQRQRRA
jgi:hypothetical protein